MKLAGGSAIVCISFPIMFVGLQFLWNELLTHIGHPFYVDHDYLWGGAVWLGWGLVILALGIFAAIRQKGSVAALVLGIMLLIAAAIALPSIRLPGNVAQMAQSDVKSTMLRISVTQSAWAKKSGRFTANQSELDEFVRAPVEKEQELVSGYARDAQRLPYRLIYIADAPGPHIFSPAGERPGMIYFAVSRDLKRFWITGTALSEAVGGEVILVPSSERAGPWIDEGRLDLPAEPPRKQQRPPGARHDAKSPMRTPGLQ